MQNIKYLAASLDKSTHAHSVSYDGTSKRKNKDLISEEYILNNEKEEMSPRSIVNNIIDQWYKVDEVENNQIFDTEFTGNESMFEFSQQMVEKYNPSVFRTLDQEDKNNNIQSQKSWLRPSTMSKNKRVTFQHEDDMEGIEIKSIHSESMSSLSSVNKTEDSPIKKESNDNNREEISNIKNFINMQRIYRPALMTKNFTHEMPLFLSEKNLENFTDLFKSMKYENKYQKSVIEARKFK